MLMTVLKFAAAIVLTVVICNVVQHFLPQVSRPAFFIQGIGITYMMMVGAVALFLSHRVVNGK